MKETDKRKCFNIMKYNRQKVMRLQGNDLHKSFTDNVTFELSLAVYQQVGNKENDIFNRGHLTYSWEC
jgi:hypothetical protein